MNKYELDDDEVDELYDYLFPQKEQFIHLADPDKQPKLSYVEKELNADDDYIHALILYRDNYATYEQAYDDLTNYRIYDREDLRNDDFEQLVYEQAELSIEDALIDGRNNWLNHYIDIDEIVTDMKADRSYAEVLSSYEEEIEAVINGINYYLYKY